MVYRMTVTPMLEEYGKDLRLSPAGILKIFENAATRHAAAVGDSVEECLKRGEAWYLTDWYVEIYTRIPMGLRVKVETFCRRDARSVGLGREFRMRDDMGNLIALSTSKWARVRVKDKRILRTDEETFLRYGALSRSVFGKIPTPMRHSTGRRGQEKVIPLRRGDFDLHEHVHNLVYLDYAFEAIPKAVYDAHAVRAFHVSYIKPICAGEEVKARTAKTAEGYTVYIEAENTLRARVDLWVDHPKT